MATPMRDCILGAGLKNPDDRVFMDWLNDGHLEVHLVVTVRVLVYIFLQAGRLN